MADDDFALFFAEKFDRFFAHELMRSAVEAVLSHFVLVVDRIRNSVHIRLCRHSAVECRIEHRNHRNARHNFSATLYASNIARHMKRPEFRILFADTDNLVVDDDGTLEVLSAVENSVSDGADFVGRFDCTVDGIDHCFEHEFDSGGVIFHILFDIEHSSVGSLLGELTAIESDTLAKSFENGLLGVHIDKLIFE